MKLKNTKLPIIEMFTSIQGEGIYTGVPSLFVRVSGCNLRCVFGNSRCDTPYSSFEAEKPICDNVNDATKKIVDIFKRNPQIEHLVITGGEPMLYANAIKELISNIYTELDDDCNITITIETNGTLPAFGVWSKSDWDYDCSIDLWSISPKLSTSVDYNNKYLTTEQRYMHDKTRINIKNLASYVKTVLDYDIDEYEDGIQPQLQFKFVYTNEDSVKEIKTLLREIEKEVDLEEGYLNKCVLLMPEGVNNEQLDNISQECVEVCMREGWRFCDRLHIRVWGDKRGV